MIKSMTATPNCQKRYF